MVISTSPSPSQIQNFSTLLKCSHSIPTAQLLTLLLFVESSLVLLYSSESKLSRAHQHSFGPKLTLDTLGLVLAA